jgi:hypothetical protein
MRRPAIPVAQDGIGRRMRLHQSSVGVPLAGCNASLSRSQPCRLVARQFRPRTIWDGNLVINRVWFGHLFRGWHDLKCSIIVTLQTPATTRKKPREPEAFYFA